MSRKGDFMKLAGRVSSSTFAGATPLRAARGPLFRARLSATEHCSVPPLRRVCHDHCQAPERNNRITSVMARNAADHLSFGATSLGVADALKMVQLRRSSREGNHEETNCPGRCRRWSVRKLGRTACRVQCHHPRRHDLRRLGRHAVRRRRSDQGRQDRLCRAPRAGTRCANCRRAPARPSRRVSSTC